ncbi:MULTISPECIES: flagellar motor protein MotB [unclassified Ruegeria]|uniref:flagellar motor protein MotB n=1 Tax=unclassified Ruegeria TaxID=2625375 RepID=UPI001492AB77|nr:MULTISPECIES: flagellar motor protein MotB [unclassified Ruegeria]NOD35494.1 OmpA family protein [Ruegeria sp. HKCCD7296]NOE43169.1 OmpA family protein [Ruegeria sp. HKCCD7319]
MGAQTNAAPIIIKKKRVSGGDGHHGGAWKVAYADFVTAMMAFFMLMWLLNATTEQQRKGLADYFAPTIPLSPESGGGDGAFGGDSMLSEDTLLRDGQGATTKYATESRLARGSVGVDAQGGGKGNKEDFSTLEAQLLGRTGESDVSDKLLKHIVTRVTDEGLVVELFDTEDQALFESGSDTPTRFLRALALIIARSSDLVTNSIAVEGHVSASPVAQARNTAWDLSTARAQKLRQLLQDKGVTARRMDRVTGHADRELFAKNPMAPRNNRVEVIFLRHP